MTEKRKVAVYEHQRMKDSYKYEKVFVGNGLFHQFGLDTVEGETGISSFSIAIVEMPDGSVKNVPVEMIVFNN